mmetsp:Transcript_27733/g.50060  ORF Transcript_27733/g.50060 Transcript_27733/m.50060 type:complete len:297 (-) Transcript_27733:951-1841(-)
MDVAAVVETAVGMRAQIGHPAPQLRGVDLAQAELLEAGGVDQGGSAALVGPVPLRRRGGVAARVQGLGDLADLGLGVLHQQVDQRALAGAAGAEHKAALTVQPGRQRGARARRVGLQCHFEHGQAHAGLAIGRQPLAGGIGAGQVGLVQRDRGADAGGLGRDQRTAELALAEHRLDRDQHEELIQVGRKAFGLPLVLAEQQVAARLDRLDDALIGAGLGKAHLIADDGVALLAAWVADKAPAVGVLDDVVAAVASHDQSQVQRLEFAHAADASGSALTWAAQIASFSVRPPRECVV